ncbi:MAG: CDP-alcohol phosphatidyltransferase family protein [Haliscomenobacteraceae bacterium CHB4]|nr:CDP-diacylglycerol--inositol 3-phosphatidyltransferase [Saprospiraceae bacterium]MCE7924433.1 CDP-alcohol phosphatidyltransferase family protein [Haliscomenobacteraceae bacterium CHB4]
MSNFLKEVGQPLVYRIINPFINLLLKAGITPNAVTTIGFIINVGATAVFIIGGREPRTDLRYVGWGGAIILFGGLFDMIDGRLARVGKMESKFGALYDSVLDRYSELAMFLGICYYLVAQNYFLSSLFAFIAMIGSIMVSYVRARAEGLGIECKGGLMQRPERILLVGISAVVCGLLADYTGQFKYTIPDTTFPIFENITLFTFPIFILAVLTNWTAIQRLRESKAVLDKLEGN